MTLETKATLHHYAARAGAPLALLLLASGFTGGSCDLSEEPQPLPEPVVACERLNEDACTVRGDCTAVYEQACACAGCVEGEPCPPCRCAEPQFTSCHPNDPCAGLDEAACNADPMCELEYLDVACPAIACAPGEECMEPLCPEPAPVCRIREPEPVCPGVVCTLYCEFGFETGPDGCEICACNEPPTPPPACEPVACRLYCEYGFATGHDGCEICACNPAPAGCETDADCPGGYCEHYATCDGLNCPPPPPAQCVAHDCDDGSPLLCLAAEPVCGPGQVVAVQDSCFACVDPRTCQ